MSQNEGVIGLYANRTYLAPACSCGRSLYDFNLAKRVASTLRHAKDTAALAPVDQMCKHCGEILTPIPADKLPQGVTPDGRKEVGQGHRPERA